MKDVGVNMHGKRNSPPPGQGTPRPPRRFDTTSCQERGYFHMLSRDYAAHCHRWGWAFRFCAGEKHRVLEVGCGKDFPLGKMLVQHGDMGKRPHHYTGVDLNELKEKDTKHTTLIGKFDFVNCYDQLLARFPDRFTVVVNFEVIEHMGVDDGKTLLKGMHEMLVPGGTLLLSTPVEHGKQARNHIHEYGIEELQTAIEGAGFVVQRRFGTFGNVNKLRKAATPEHLAVMNELAAYYSDDQLCLFLAPLYPDACKNNFWVCTK